MARIYQALEIRDSDGKGTGRWHMTVGSDEEHWVHAVGYCAQDCEGHPTAAEAERHHKEYVADHARVWNATSAHKCEGCGEWTPRIVELHVTVLHLCEKCDTGRDARLATIDAQRARYKERSSA